jgi:poly(3-hydroxybutyrate) depolymerase
MQARMGCKAMVAAVAVVAGTLGVVRAQTANVAGDWTFNVQTDQGSGTPAISFKQDGETLTGTYAGTFGNAVLKGTIKGAAIEFSFTADAQGQTVDSVYKGTVEKDTMKGTVAIAGGQIGGTFTASRKK